MKFSRALIGALGAAAAVAAMPASAQVNGLATANPVAVISASQALQTGYSQIGQTYASVLQTLGERRAQANTLSQQIDADGNGEVTQEEVNANQAVAQQVQALQSEIDSLSQPIARAQLYVVSQVRAQYSAALQTVVSERSISMVLNPDTVLYSPQEADVTVPIIEALDARLPAVSTAVPEGWAPTDRQIVQLYQQVQQFRMIAAAAQQQQQQGAGAAAEQPVGR